MGKKYIVVDYHKRYAQIVVMDEKGKVESIAKLATESGEIQRYTRRIEGEKEAVLEASMS